LGQPLSPQATLLASLDYFSIIVIFGLFAGVCMLAQRVMK